VGHPGRLEICGLLRALNEPLPFVRWEKCSNVNILGTLSMALAKEVAKNAEVSESDILFVVGVYHGNIPGLHAERGGTACIH
jgi:hypothetical protein